MDPFQSVTPYYRGGRSGDPTEDYLAISDALLAVANQGGGIVLLEAKTYTIATTLVVRNGVTLWIPTGCTVECTADTDAIEIRMGGFVTGGGRVYLSNATLSDTTACLLVDAANGDSDFEDDYTGASHLALGTNNTQSGNNVGDGCGIRLQTNADGQNLFGLKFSDLWIDNCHYGIYLLATGGTSGSSVNANQFNNISLDHCYENIYIDGNTSAPDAANGNFFTNIQIQIRNDTNRGVYVAGKNNFFIPITFWDVGAGTTIEFAAGNSFGNVVHSPDVLISNMAGNYANNSWLTPYGAIERNRTVANVPTASDYTGKIVYVTDDVGGAVPAFSDGTNWRRVTDRAIVSVS